MTLNEATIEYNKRFGDGFPTIVFTEERAIEIMLDCIDKGKDAYELGYVTDDEDEVL